MTKITTTPINSKTILKFYPEPGGLSYWDLVCSIGDVGPTKFDQIMILS